MASPVDRDLIQRTREMRRKLAQDAMKPRPMVEVEDLAAPEAEGRLGPNTVIITNPPKGWNP